MTEATGGIANDEKFLEFLKTLAWCKQGQNILVAVHKGTTEIIEAIADHEIKVFPSAMTIKMNKSTLHHFQQMLDDSQPLPVVLVWKPEGVGIWYRRDHSQEFPYDSWLDPSKTEKERVFIPADRMGAKATAYHGEILSKSKACPPIIPPQEI